MRVVGFNGSPRRDGNTFILIYIKKMIGADGILLGSPVYFTDVTSEIKALIDRAGYVSRANGRMLKNKIGVGVVGPDDRSGSWNCHGS